MTQIPLALEKVWLGKARYERAERIYYENLARGLSQSHKHVCPKTESVKKVEPTNKVTSPLTPPLTSPLTSPLSEEKVWLAKSKYSQAERSHYEKLEKERVSGQNLEKIGVHKRKFSEVDKDPNEVEEKVKLIHPLAEEKAWPVEEKKLTAEPDRDTSEKADKIDDIEAMAANNVSADITNRLNKLEIEKNDLKCQVDDLKSVVKVLESRLAKLEVEGGKAGTPSGSQQQPARQHPPPPAAADDEDDGVDLFGSESEEEDVEAQKIKEQRLAEYAARKSKKPVLIAKSNIILDVKPWDDETDMKLLEKEVRKVNTEGLVWGASKLVPLAYGIHKLQISCVVEDEKVSVDWLQETIQEIEDYVQSVDIAAFNKV